MTNKITGKIRVTLTTVDGEVLDAFNVWDQDRPEFTPETMAQRLEDYIGRRYEMEEHKFIK